MYESFTIPFKKISQHKYALRLYYEMNKHPFHTLNKRVLSIDLWSEKHVLSIDLWSVMDTQDNNLDTTLHHQSQSEGFQLTDINGNAWQGISSQQDVFVTYTTRQGIHMHLM